MALIADFKARLAGGGARANQFRAILTFPAWVGLGSLAGQAAQFLCHSTSMPQSTVDPITVLYRGRPVQLAGERTFAPWTVSIYNDVDFAIRNAFEQWSNGISNNAATNGYTAPLDYQATMQVQQLDRNGNVLKVYEFRDAFPTEVTPITLGYDQGTAIESFDVTFVYNMWISNTTNPLGESNLDYNGAVLPAGSGVPAAPTTIAITPA